MFQLADQHTINGFIHLVRQITAGADPIACGNFLVQYVHTNEALLCEGGDNTGRLMPSIRLNSASALVTMGMANGQHSLVISHSVQGWPRAQVTIRCQQGLGDTRKRETGHV